jgi:hypothetical protein
LDDGIFSTILENYGFGPAIIDKYYFKYRNNLIDIDSVINMKADLFLESIPVQKYNLYFYRKGEPFGANQKKEIFIIELKNKSKKYIKLMQERISEIELFIEYKSIYNEKYLFNEKLICVCK